MVAIVDDKRLTTVYASTTLRWLACCINVRSGEMSVLVIATQFSMRPQMATAISILLICSSAALSLLLQM